MADLVRVDLDLLPAEPRYRPLGKAAWYGRRIPSALAVGAVVGVCSVAVHPMAMWVAIIGIFGWSIARRRRMVGVLQKNDDALALLVSGELDAAATAYDDLCGQARGAPGLHSLLVYNRAAVYLDAGDPERAAGLLSAVLHAGWIGPKGSLTAYYPAALGRLAMAEALRGRLDQAQTWRARAHAATSAAKRGMHLLVDMVVEAKLQHYETVVTLAEEGWTRAENMLTARQLRVARMLEAFALEHLGTDEYRGVSRETDLARALEAARSSSAGEFQFLTAHWDELERFTQRHRL
ncbi:MAG: hypothetical protein AAGA54_03295 [Myxococcota bacterium]